MSKKTRDRIKTVALTLFASNGYDSTSMENIATGVGIKKSSLYTFISSKEELYWEIYEDLEAQYHIFMKSLLLHSENMSPAEQLYYLFKQYLVGPVSSLGEDAAVIRKFWLRVMFFPPLVLKEQLLKRTLAQEKRLSEKYSIIIRAGIQQGLIRESPPEEILLSYYSLRQGLYSLMNVFMADMSEEQKICKIDTVWHNFWQGIKGR